MPSLAKMNLIAFYQRVFREEAKRRKWIKVVDRAVRVLGFFGVSATALYVVWSSVLHTWFSTSLLVAWAISVMVLIGAFMLLLLRFAQTYHVRILREAGDEWSRYVPIIKDLGGYLYEGKKIKEEFRNPAQTCDAAFMDRLRHWHQYTASALHQALGEQYRARFYEGSNTGTDMPSQLGDLHTWTHNRLYALETIIREIETIPAQLAVESCEPKAELVT